MFTTLQSHNLNFIMKRYNLHKTNLFFYTLITFFFIIQYVLCELPPSQITTMNNLHTLLQNNSNSKWNNSQNLSNPCSWIGVSCARNDSFVSKLFLSSFSISNAQKNSDSDSSWASLVCEIDTLESLDLSNNQLTVIPKPFLVPSCGMISHLKVLNFSNNNLVGSVSGFRGFSSLEVLDLSQNMIVDLQFDGLNELKSLNISLNMFRGSIPTKLGNSTLFKELQLSFNLFSGVIPNEIINNRNLSFLDFSNNQLSGTIPFRIGELTHLEFLILSDNNLSGEIPNSISSITSLKRFAANQNRFSGSIPLGITRYLRYFDLSYNNLKGSIPSDLLSYPNLLTVDLSFNELEGSLPSNLSKSLVRLRLGNNKLSGEIPRFTFVNDVPSLTYLELGHNRLNGPIPSVLKSFKNLSLLDLSYNELDGSIPRELCNLNQLQIVQLSHNNLSGAIPTEINRLQKLLKLNISWNSISGPIPSSLPSLTKLENLDLQVNNLNGEMPDSFGTMDSLLELQLGKNRLEGVVKSLPLKLQIALNLSRNNFKGPIPSVLIRLQSLEVLDLSKNRFSGEIPPFLASMSSLTLIELSDNMLTGSMPQFGSNVNVFTDGNMNLSPESNPSPKPYVSRKRKPLFVAIVAASASAVFVFLLATISLVSLIVLRRIQKVNDDQTRSCSIVKSRLLTSNAVHRSNLDITKAIESVKKPSNFVSKTRFSTYYKAVLPSGSSYFVKTINSSDKIFQLGSHGLFETELQVVGNLRNSNVMIPIAYALTTDSAYLFYEFNEKGNLFDVLHGSLVTSLDWTNRYNIAIGVANGLAFLHGCPSGPIILLDLSSRVVMLKSLNEPQIGDIELSKVIDPTKSTGNLSAVAGSVGYVPPEYAYTMRVTTAGNVYSFGVILLELLTGKPAVSEGSELAKWVSSKTKQRNNFDKILDSTISRTSPGIKVQMLAVLNVALACVSISPDARPKMKSVLRMLLNARN